MQIYLPHKTRSSTIRHLLTCPPLVLLLSCDKEYRTLSSCWDLAVPSVSRYSLSQRIQDALVLLYLDVPQTSVKIVTKNTGIQTVLLLMCLDEPCVPPKYLNVPSVTKNAACHKKYRLLSSCCTSMYPLYSLSPKNAGIQTVLLLMYLDLDLDVTKNAG